MLPNKLRPQSHSTCDNLKPPCDQRHQWKTSNFQQPFVNLLGEIVWIHNFIVCQLLGDWWPTCGWLVANQSQPVTNWLQPVINQSLTSHWAETARNYHQGGCKVKERFWVLHWIPFYKWFHHINIFLIFEQVKHWHQKVADLTSNQPLKLLSPRGCSVLPALCDWGRTNTSC